MVRSNLLNSHLKKYFGVICTLIFASQLIAAELTHVEVERKGKRFYMDSTLVIDAPLESMYAILTDYNSMHQFSRGIVHSQEVTPDAKGARRVYTHIRGCIAFLCRNIERVERLETRDNNHIVTTLDPALSENVAWNLSTWDLESIEVEQENPDTKMISRTQIRYQMEFEPDFWVPPIIGGYIVKKSLSEDGLEIMTRMEAHAQGKYPIYPTKNKNKIFPKLELNQPNFVEMKKRQEVETKIETESKKTKADAQ